MAKPNAIHFVVVTPERQVLDETTDSLVIPAHDGELGILDGRAPLMCELGPGQLRYQQAGRTRAFFVDGGFAQVHDNLVTILTPAAVAVDEITPDMVTAAEKSAEAAAANPVETPENRFRAQRRVNVLRALR